MPIWASRRVIILIQIREQIGYGVVCDQVTGFRLSRCLERLRVGIAALTAAGCAHLVLSPRVVGQWVDSTLAVILVQAGMDRAAAEGRTGGRPPALDSEKLLAVRDFLDGGGSVSAASRTFGVSLPTVRAVKDGTYPV